MLVPTPVAQAEPAAAAKESSSVAPAQRDELLGKGWQESGDRLWTTTGDSDGLRLLVAEAKTGYTWRTVATLSQPGVETDRWIGNACVTGSGQRAVDHGRREMPCRTTGHVRCLPQQESAPKRSPTATSLANDGASLTAPARRERRFGHARILHRACSHRLPLHGAKDGHSASRCRNPGNAR